MHELPEIDGFGCAVAAMHHVDADQPFGDQFFFRGRPDFRFALPALAALQAKPRRRHAEQIDRIFQLARRGDAQHHRRRRKTLRFRYVCAAVLRFRELRGIQRKRHAQLAAAEKQQCDILSARIYPLLFPTRARFYFIPVTELFREARVLLFDRIVRQRQFRQKTVIVTEPRAARVQSRQRQEALFFFSRHVLFVRLVECGEVFLVLFFRQFFRDDRFHDRLHYDGLFRRLCDRLFDGDLRDGLFHNFRFGQRFRFRLSELSDRQNDIHDAQYQARRTEADARPFLPAERRREQIGKAEGHTVQSARGRTAVRIPAVGGDCVLLSIILFFRLTFFDRRAFGSIFGQCAFGSIFGRCAFGVCFAFGRILPARFLHLFRGRLARLRGLAVRSGGFAAVGVQVTCAAVGAAGIQIIRSAVRAVRIIRGALCGGFLLCENDRSDDLAEQHRGKHRNQPHKVCLRLRNTERKGYGICRAVRPNVVFGICQRYGNGIFTGGGLFIAADGHVIRIETDGQINEHAAVFAERRFIRRGFADRFRRDLPHEADGVSARGEHVVDRIFQREHDAVTAGIFARNGELRAAEHDVCLGGHIHQRNVQPLDTVGLHGAAIHRIRPRERRRIDRDRRNGEFNGFGFAARIVFRSGNGGHHPISARIHGFAFKLIAHGAVVIGIEHERHLARPCGNFNIHAAAEHFPGIDRNGDGIAFQRVDLPGERTFAAALPCEVVRIGQHDRDHVIAGIRRIQFQPVGRLRHAQIADRNGHERAVVAVQKVALFRAGKLGRIEFQHGFFDLFGMDYKLYRFR